MIVGGALGPGGVPGLDALGDAAMFVDDFFGYHQTDTGAVGSLGAEKTLENIFSDINVHPAAGIFNPVLHSPRVFFSGTNRHFFFFVNGISCTGIKSVGHQIEQTVVDEVGIEMARTDSRIDLVSFRP